MTVIIQHHVTLNILKRNRIRNDMGAVANGAIVISVLGSVSMIGSIFILFTVVFFGLHKSTSHRLIAYLSLSGKQLQFRFLSFRLAPIYRNTIFVPLDSVGRPCFEQDVCVSIAL